MSSMSEDEQRIATLAAERLFHALPPADGVELLKRVAENLTSRGIDSKHFAAPLRTRQERNRLLVTERPEDFKTQLAAVVEEEKAIAAERESARELSGAPHRESLRAWAQTLKHEGVHAPKAALGAAQRARLAGPGRDLAAGRDEA